MEGDRPSTWHMPSAGHTKPEQARPPRQTSGQGHSHSEVPEKDEDWPTLEDILAYRDRVRARLMALYDDVDAGKRVLDRTLARVLQMTLEHEGFHIEV